MFLNQQFWKKEACGMKEIMAAEPWSDSCLQKQKGLVFSNNESRVRETRCLGQNYSQKHLWPPCVTKFSSAAKFGDSYACTSLNLIRDQASSGCSLHRGGFLCKVVWANRCCWFRSWKHPSTCRHFLGKQLCFLVESNILEMFDMQDYPWRR